MPRTLPPLPPSDTDSLSKNYFDKYYNRSARSFWGENEVIRIPDTPAKRCRHEFEMVTQGVKCRKCNFGLSGQGLSVNKDGGVLIQGKQFKFPEK